MQVVGTTELRNIKFLRKGFGAREIRQVKSTVKRKLISQLFIQLALQAVNDKTPEDGKELPASRWKVSPVKTGYFLPYKHAHFRPWQAAQRDTRDESQSTNSSLLGCKNSTQAQT
jgi:hypothetical protein